MVITPASIRNHNPGAMEPGPSSRKFGSTGYETLRWKGPDGKPKTNRIATFATPQHGAAAQFDLLHRRYTGKPLSQAVATWCGGYWAGEYAAKVEAACGLSGDDVLTHDIVADPDRAIPIAQAMARMEAGCDFPMDADGWRAAHGMAFGDGLAPAPSPTNDVPFRKPEAATRDRNTALARVGAAVTTAGAAATQAKDMIPSVPVGVKDALANAKELQNVGGEIAAIGKSIWALPTFMLILIGACFAAYLLLRKLMNA
jgi:hypothetical protein